MKSIYIVTNRICTEAPEPESLMAFDCKEDAEKMAKINRWSVKELLLVESNKAQVNLREVLPIEKGFTNPTKPSDYPFYSPSCEVK